jgi:heme oxygenase
MPDGAPRTSGLADLLWARTDALHRQAERSGIIGALVTGQASVGQYALFLRNLVPVYHELERGLGRHGHRRATKDLLRRELVRGAALESDLIELAGNDWRRQLPVLPAGERYAHRVATASEGDGGLLIAHAYTRYLGDLGGGPLLKRLVATAFHLDARGLAFYEFPGVASVRAFARDYRAALDAAGEWIEDPERVAREAALAFQLNIDLSLAVAEGNAPV